MATVYTMSSTDHARFDESLEKVLKDAAATGAEVAYRAGQFQVTGTMAEVRQALPVIVTSDAVKVGRSRCAARAALADYS